MEVWAKPRLQAVCDRAQAQETFAVPDGVVGATQGARSWPGPVPPTLLYSGMELCGAPEFRIQTWPPSSYESQGRSTEYILQNSSFV